MPWQAGPRQLARLPIGAAKASAAALVAKRVLTSSPRPKEFPNNSKRHFGGESVITADQPDARRGSERQHLRPGLDGVLPAEGASSPAHGRPRSARPSFVASCGWRAAEQLRNFAPGQYAGAPFERQPAILRARREGPWC